MGNDEKIRSFVDMVGAAERLARPWQIALILTNLLWAIRSSRKVDDLGKSRSKSADRAENGNKAK